MKKSLSDTKTSSRKTSSSLKRKVNPSRNDGRNSRTTRKTETEEEIQYVLPIGNGWVVKLSSAKKFTLISNSGTEAIDIARSIAKHKQIRLMVYGKNGRVLKDEKY